MTRFKNLKWYFKKNYYKYLLAMFFIVISVGLEIIKPKLIGYAVKIVDSGQIERTLFISLVIALFAVVILKFMFSTVKRVFIGGIFHNLYYELKLRFINSLLKQDANFFTKFHSGDLMTRATSDTFSMSNVSSHLILNFFEVVLLIIFTAVMMILIDPLLTLYSVLPLPFIFVIVASIRPKISANWRLVRKRNSDLGNKAMESVQHVKLIRAFCNEENDFHKLDDIAYDCYKIEKKSVLLQSIFGPTFRFFSILSQLIAFIIGIKYISIGRISIDELVTFNLFLAQFSMPMLQLGNQVGLFAQSKISFERMEEILTAKPDIIDKDNSIEIEDFKTIEFKNLHFSYEHNEVIKGIDLLIEKGKTLGIVGKTGSGKTTIVRQLLREYVIDESKILIDGISINEISKESIRRLVAYVPQEHVLFSRTVLENLELGRSPETQISEEKAIEMADFAKDIPYLENGLNTVVGEYGVTLSGGQKQRLSIARAFMKDAKILILDDSLSAVDGTTEANIIQNLRNLRSGQTNIIIAHRLSAVEHADKIIVIDNGKIVEEGTHKDLMNQSGWYKEQFEIQQMEDHHE